MVPAWGLKPWVFWLNVCSDGAIALACGLVLLTLVRLFPRREPGLTGILALAGALTLAFGLTHALEAFHFWSGSFHSLGAVKAGTAAAGLAAGVLLPGLAPRLAGPATGGVAGAKDGGSARETEDEDGRILGRLEDEETRFRAFIEGVKEYAIFRLDPDGRVATWNQGAERIYGYQGEESLGQHLSRFCAEDGPGADLADRALEQARAEGRSEQEGWQVRKDGTRFFAVAHLSAIRDRDGQLLGFARVIRDVTERRDSEARIQKLARDLARKVEAQGEELLESGAMVKGIIEYAPAAVALKNLEGRFLIVNPRMETLIGRPQSEILGRGNGEVFPPEIASRLQGREDRVVGLRQALEVEEQWVHPDGSSHAYLSHQFPLVDALGTCWGLGIISTDITERKQADQAMLQHQKMESLGLLAGGIAHDFNNLLGAIQGNLELAKLDLPAGAAVPEHLQVLEGLTGNASYLVGQMLTYAGKGPFKEEALDLNRVVEEMVHLLRASISKKAVIRYDPDPHLPGINGDASQIQQLVMNLVLNASEALGEDGGIISLRTGMETLSGAYLRTVYEGQGLQPGPHATLEVADTGVGMTEDVRKRIFDPFFTTKFTGRGLGLSAIQGIVRTHRGGIRVYSEPGEGTQFKVVLPAVAPAQVAAPGPEEILETFRGSGTVLVVEDEDSMRSAAVKLLNHAGFDTLQAGDGFEALRILERHRERIRLILMDLTMPRMGGEEAYREMRQRGIRTPVILSSGFHEKEALRRFRGQGLAGFLQKPYRYNVLLKMLREALET